jgi:hypothetical protein
VAFAPVAVLTEGVAVLTEGGKFEDRRRRTRRRPRLVAFADGRTKNDQSWRNQVA